MTLRRLRPANSGSDPTVRTQAVGMEVTAPNPEISVSAPCDIEVTKAGCQLVIVWM